MNTTFFISAVIGYLLGSIPFALVVGKVFYHKDIRQYGSGNLGGGNAGRVLGKKAGLAVMTLDILKVTLAIFLARLLSAQENVLILAGLFAAAGHCYPIFAHFKGGKAVATMYGFLFGMVIVGGYPLWIFLLPLGIFMIVLYLTKIIALASIFSALGNTFAIYFLIESLPLAAASLIFTIVIIVRHRGNLKRIREGIENKISWM